MKWTGNRREMLPLLMLLFALLGWDVENAGRHHLLYDEHVVKIP